MTAPSTTSPTPTAAATTTVYVAFLHEASTAGVAVYYAARGALATATRTCGASAGAGGGERGGGDDDPSDRSDAQQGEEGLL